MKHSIRTYSIILLVLALPLSLTPAAATTCSQRHKSCLNTCATTYSKSPGCSTQCAEGLARCQSDGCWVNKMNNQCGLTKG